jgi:hypothetical protein
VRFLSLNEDELLDMFGLLAFKLGEIEGKLLDELNYYLEIV